MSVPKAYTVQTLFKQRFTLGHRLCCIELDPTPQGPFGLQQRRVIDLDATSGQVAGVELAHGLLACQPTLDVATEHLKCRRGKLQ
jgi:hypothetical protein